MNVDPAEMLGLIGLNADAGRDIDYGMTPAELEFLDRATETFKRDNGFDWKTEAELMDAHYALYERQMQHVNGSAA